MAWRQEKVDCLRFFFLIIFAVLSCGAYSIINVSCNRLLDSVRSFTHSTATVTGVVLDSLTEKPVANAIVTIGKNNGTTTTDSSGKFRFDDLLTGKYDITISADNFKTFSTFLDVCLETEETIYRIIRADATPVIDTIIIDTASMLFLDDNLKIFLSANDSSGGIEAVILTVREKDKETVLEHRYNTVCYSLKDSFFLTCRSPGEITGLLKVIGYRSDTTEKILLIDLLKPRRPHIVRVRASREGFPDGQEGFICNKPGYLQIYISDPDNVLGYILIEWGDSSTSTTSSAPEGTYWHIYTSESQRMPVTLRLFDKHSSITGDTILYFQVRKINPPLLDNRLFFSPCQYCSPLDTAILIGVRILQIYDNWVSQIIWTINENDPPPLSFYQRIEYDRATGAVIDSIGNLFVHKFSTSGLKGTNTVQVRVIDSEGNSSTVSATFYIAGRPD